MEWGEEEGASEAIRTELVESGAACAGIEADLADLADLADAGAGLRGGGEPARRGDGVGAVPLRIGRLGAARHDGGKVRPAFRGERAGKPADGEGVRAALQGPARKRADRGAHERRHGGQSAVRSEQRGAGQDHARGGAGAGRARRHGERGQSGAGRHGWMPGETWEHVRAATPLGRLGTPDDTAHLADFLCAPRGQWVSGQVLMSNGGFA
ncbi:putative short chain dehydrogenase [Streptomyces sp. Tu6071]|nr:putative short chain dehydrogenase [Streptomyces sp. Tu6071]